MNDINKLREQTSNTFNGMLQLDFNTILSHT